jgi:hypothetical protein
LIKNDDNLVKDNREVFKFSKEESKTIENLKEYLKLKESIKEEKAT